MMQLKSHDNDAPWSFSVRMRALRGELGLTQSAMADRLEVSKGAYISWENGNAKPSVDIVKRIETELGIGPEWLFRDGDGSHAGLVDAERLERIFDTLLREVENYNAPMSAKALLRLSSSIASDPVSQERYAIERAIEHIKAMRRDDGE